jgi:endonuclease YncB( thermonuclease family)
MGFVPTGLLAAAILVCAAFAAAAEIVSGPVEARVVRVIDGDTFVAEARIWPGQSVRVSVRIRGIDAPEMRSRCAAEKRAAARARGALATLLGDGLVLLSNIGGGKYYGRVLADVAVVDGRDVAPALIADAVARAYDGGRRLPICAR